MLGKPIDGLSGLSARRFSGQCGVFRHEGFNWALIDENCCAEEHDRGDGPEDVWLQIHLDLLSGAIGFLSGARSTYEAASAQGKQHRFRLLFFVSADDPKTAMSLTNANPPRHKLNPSLFCGTNLVAGYKI